MKYIICDLDGTVADHHHRLHYILPPEDPNEAEFWEENWDTFNAESVKDQPYTRVVEILKAMRDLHTPRKEILYITAREGTALNRKLTEDWIEKHLPVGRLFMRDASDRRDDTVIKAEIVDKVLKLTKEDVYCVLEDRTRVVKMWRSKGFFTLQVADGDY